MMQTRTFTVPNIGCAACVSKIKDEIGQLGGVTQVVGDQATRIVTVQWQAPATWQLIETRLIEIDYPPATS
jgi:copper chaperone